MSEEKEFDEVVETHEGEDLEEAGSPFSDDQPEEESEENTEE